MLRLLGRLHTRTQRHDDAIDALEQAISHCPNYALAHSDLATCFRPSDMAAAAASWRRACALAPNAPTPWFNLGRNLQQQGDTHAAVDAMQTTHQLVPDFLPALILLGDAKVYVGRFQDADVEYREARALHPYCGDAWRGLANMDTRLISDADRAQLAAMLQRTDLAAADPIALGFASGKINEDRGL